MKKIWRTTASASLVLALLAACGGKTPEALVTSAQSYIAKGDLKAASIQIKNALQSNPDLPEARYWLGVVFLNGGNPVAAEQEFRKALALKYPADTVLPKLAASLLARNDFQKLTQELADAPVTSPAARAELQTLLSKAHAALGNARAADAALSAALAADPTYPAARLLQARKKAVAADYDGALAVLDDLLGKSPSDAEALTLRGDVLRYGKHDSAAALASYRKAVEAKPDHLPGHMSIIAALLADKNLEAAAVEVAAMKKAAPGAPQTIYEEARLAYLRKDDKLASERAQALLKRSPNNAAALQLAGAIELQANALAKAEAHLSQALQLAPESLAARQFLVTTYLRSGKPEKALNTMQVAQVRGELPPGMYSLAGEVYLRNGDNKRAEEYFAKATQLDPNDAGKRTTLALTRMIRGQVDVAFEELEGIASADKGSAADMALISARLQRKQFDKALVAIDALEQKRPDQPVAAQLRGRTQLLLNNPAAARKSFEHALQVSPGYFPAITSLASLDLAEKKPDDARKRFEGVVAKDPAHGQALLALAQITAMTGGDHKEVVALINRAIAADRLDVAARRALIDLYLRDKELKQASVSALDAVAVIPDHPELLDALGRAQRASGELNQALATYNKLAALQPDSAQPLMRAADVQIALGDKTGAEQSLRRALDITPDLLDAQFRMVSLHVGAKRYADALAVARTVQKQRPKEASGFLLEGDIGLSQGNQDVALAAFRRGLAQAPTSQLAVKVHSVLMASPKSADAEHFASGWVREHPADAAFLFHLGDVALTRKDYPAAMDRYLAVVRLQPREAAAYNNLAWLANQVGKPSALEYAKKANEIDPAQPAYMDTMATVLASNRDYPGAIQLQKKALALQPDNPQWRLNLARIYKQSGDRKLAREELEALAKLGPKFPAQAEVSSLLGAL